MKRTILTALAVLVLGAGVANAASIVFSLDQNNIGLSGGPWATITLTDITSSGGLAGVRIVVDPLASAFTSTGTNFGLQRFYFNENTSFGNQLTLTNFDPTGWTWRYASPGASNAGGGFGKFEFLTAGVGSTRADPLTFDVFAPVGQSLAISNLSVEDSTEGYIFAAHIADFNAGKSAKFATDGSAAVPEPASMLLLGTGLLGGGFFARRRKK